MSELVAQQLRYWNEFLAHVRRSGKDVIGARGPYKSTANELLVNVGGGDGVELRAWMDRRDGFIAVSLYLTGARKHGVYQTLLETRREIDEALSYGVSDWIHPGDPEAGYVAPMKKYADPTDEVDWPIQFEWLQDTLERFDAVFKPIVKRL